MNIWVEYTHIVYKNLSNEGQIIVQQVHETTKRDRKQYEDQQSL